MDILGPRSQTLGTWLAFLLAAGWIVYELRKDDQLPTGATMSSGNLLLTVLVGILFISATMHVIAAVIHRRQPDPPTPLPPVPVVVIRDQRIVNRTVPLDNHSYLNCKFENVTFVFNGGRVDFNHNEVSGWTFTTENPTVWSTIAWLQGFGLLKVPMSIEGVEPPGNLDDLRREQNRVAGFNPKTKAKKKTPPSR